MTFDKSALSLIASADAAASSSSLLQGGNVPAPSGARDLVRSFKSHLLSREQENWISVNRNECSSCCCCFQFKAVKLGCVV